MRGDDHRHVTVFFIFNESATFQGHPDSGIIFLEQREDRSTGEQFRLGPAGGMFEVKHLQTKKQWGAGGRVVLLRLPWWR